MASVNLWTYRDSIRQLVDYLGASPNAEASREARRAILAAYREFATAHNWSYFYQRGRVVTNAPYTTGTIQYVNSTRTITITGGTFPTWAPFGIISFNNVPYDVVSNPTSTTLVLSVNSNPGADVSVDTSYTLYRDCYPMPVDFHAADALVALGNSISYPVYVHPSNWLVPQQLQRGPTTPVSYTFTSDPHYFGTMAVRFFPAPDQIYNYDFIYQRRPRSLATDEYKAGTVVATAGSAVVAGTGTTWLAKHVGSVIRVSANATDEAEGVEWSTPFQEERVVASVASTTSLTVDTAFTNTWSGVKYVLSDPIDVEVGAMLNCFQRCCEKQVGITRIMKNKESAESSYLESLILAREADSRSLATRVAGPGGAYRQRLAYMPRGGDVG